MSKSDEIRALREARYERARANAAARLKHKPAKPQGAVTKAEQPKKAGRSDPRATEPQPSADQEQLCGHRSMNGRTCTREHGHAAKSHRYS